MKNIIIIISFLVCTQVFAQRKPKIKGNKNVVTVNESLPAFNTIELNDDLEINLQQANQEGYVINADDNLIDVLKFKVQDSTLYITSFYKITGKKKLEITVKYYELSKIILRDGRMQMADIMETDDLTINTYGSAKLQLNATTSSANLLMEGNSSGDLTLNSDALNVVLKDRIDVSILSASERMNFDMSSNSAANVEGTAYALSATLSGNANLKARKLEAEGVEVIAEGSPSARVYASDVFELTSKGSSKTYLSGKPKIDILEFLDTSELHKEK